MSNNYCKACLNCKKHWRSDSKTSCHEFCKEFQEWRYPKNGVYLAGSIDRVSAEFALEWRKKAKLFLEEHGYLVLDPTEGKDLYKHNIDRKNYTKETAWEQIVLPDLAKIKRASFLLVEISKKDCPYHGTSMELVYGSLWGKTIVVWGDVKSAWVIYHSTIILPTLGDALEYIVKE